MRFKFLDDLTSDVMFEAYGKNLKELFENSALALFNVICQIKKIKPTKKIKVEVKANNLEELIFNWLQELISLVDIKSMFFSKFKILKINETSLKAEIIGEPIEPEKGETVVKAVTNYGFKLEKDKKGHKVTVSLDI